MPAPEGAVFLFPGGPPVSKNAQQRAAKLARILNHVGQPAPLPPTPPRPPRVFPRVRVPFYLPELFGLGVSC